MFVCKYKNIYLYLITSILEFLLVLETKFTFNITIKSELLLKLVLENNKTTLLTVLSKYVWKNSLLIVSAEKNIVF